MTRIRSRASGALRLGASRAALLGFAALLGPALGSAQAQCDRSPILVRNARVWSPSEPAQVRDVLFESGRIARIAPGGSIPRTGPVRVLDGKGQTLLPGLVDLHLHFGVPGGLPEGGSAPPSRHWEITGRQLLQSGVTSGRTHMTSLAGAALLRKDAANPCSALPRLQFGGPEMAGGTPEHDTPNSVGVRSPDDAAAKARRIAEAGFDWISLYDARKFLSGELQAIAVAARRAGVRLMGTAPSAEEMNALLPAEPDTIDHIDLTTADRYPDDLLRRLKEIPNVTLVPTIGYSFRIHAFDRAPRLLGAASNYEFLTPEEKAFVWSSAKDALTRDGYVVNSRRVYSTLETKFRQLLATGLPIATGTDVGSADHFHSGGIWWELEALHAFGASPHNALAAATVNGARVLRDERAGVLTEGAHADFVLYSGDAEQGAFELGRVRAVAKEGVLFVQDGVWVGPKREGAPGRRA